MFAARSSSFGRFYLISGDIVWRNREYEVQSQNRNLGPSVFLAYAVSAIR